VLLRARKPLAAAATEAWRRCNPEIPSRDGFLGFARRDAGVGKLRRYLMFYFVIRAFCDDRVDVPMANGVFGELPALSLLPGTGNA
jgi:hypothetical protein